MEYTHVKFTFGPVFDENSLILVLGSFPSVKSREQNFYYGHPQNRFWRVLAKVTKNEVPISIHEKKNFLLNNHIALWDVIESCDIVGSSDSSIRNVIPNNIDLILQNANISAIFANGDKAYKLFQRYCVKENQPKLIKLPSTSPANAAFSLEKLEDVWKSALSKYI